MLLGVLLACEGTEQHDSGWYHDERGHQLLLLTDHSGTTSGEANWQIGLPDLVCGHGLMMSVAVEEWQASAVSTPSGEDGESEAVWVPVVHPRDSRALPRVVQFSPSVVKSLWVTWHTAHCVCSEPLCRRQRKWVY